MATTLSTILQFAVHWNYSETDGANREFTDRNALAIPQAFAELTNGTGDQMANGCFHERRTLTDAAHAYDLAGGLTNYRGVALTMARIKFVAVQVLSTASNALLTIGGGSNPFISWLAATGDGIKLGPKGLFLLHRPDATGYVVTAGTGDVLTVTATNEVVYDIVIIGADA